MAQKHELNTLNCFLVISLLMPPSWGTGLPYGLPTRRTGHNSPRGPSADWWMLTIANDCWEQRLNVPFQEQRSSRY
jgi:hypothetical protein